MVSSASILLMAVVTIYPCSAFHSGRPSTLSLGRPSNVNVALTSSEDASTQCAEPSTLDTEIASQFTIQVCTSTNCSRKLKEVGLDQYHALGEIYAQAESANLEKCIIIEDGGCQGGKNCKMGPCVGIMHEDFDGNVALDGMNSNEFQQRVFHNVMTNDDAARVWIAWRMQFLSWQRKQMKMKAMTRDKILREAASMCKTMAQ